MPRDSSGIYTFPQGSGNPVQSGTTISTNWANPTLDDIAATLTASLDRNGSGAMFAPIRGPDGSPAAPSYSFSSEVSTGRYLANPGEVVEVVGGTNVVRYTASGIEQWTGSEWEAITRQDAADVPFDNTGTSFANTNVQDVLALELDTLYPVVPVANGGTGVTDSTGSGDVVLSTAATLINCLATTVATDDDSTAIATTAWHWNNVNIVQTGSMSSSRSYLIFSDGLVIQWGRKGDGIEQAYLNFAVSLVDPASCGVWMQNEQSSASHGGGDYDHPRDQNGGWPVIKNNVVYTHGFDMSVAFLDSGHVWWLAIGY